MTIGAEAIDFETAAGPSARSIRWTMLRHNHLAMLGLVILTLIVLGALLANVIASAHPLELDPVMARRPPSRQHLMGTDNYGRDIFARVLHAARLDLLIALSSVSIGAFIGVLIGAVAGYVRGVFDELLMRFLDVLQAFPAFVLAMGLAVALGAGTGTIIVVVAVIMVPVFARLTRSVMVSERQRAYADAARSMGASSTETVFLHLLPNCLTPVMAQFPLSLSYAILDAAALSFIGLGVPPPTPEWGNMVRDGVRYLTTGEWWMAIFPGGIMALTILAFNLLGDGLRDVFDPRTRR